MTTEEIKHAGHTWLKAFREKHSASDKFLKIKSSLKLFVDDNGILRCQSRLSETENLSFNYCNPIYIPHEEHFVKLAILKAHNHVCHSGVESTLNQLRTKYWIVKGHQKVKTILKTCVVCRLCQGKPFLPPASPPLPNCRISFNHSFEITGIDYAGPLLIRDSSSKNMKKCYFLLLTCASTRCVRLELVIDYRWQSLVLALKRFKQNDEEHQNYSYLIVSVHLNPEKQQTSWGIMAFCGSLSSKNHPGGEGFMKI